jgi:hypothetical protein
MRGKSMVPTKAPPDQHRDEEALSWVVASEPVYEEPLSDDEQDDEAEHTSDYAAEYLHCSDKQQRRAVNTVLQSATLGSRSGRT